VELATEPICDLVRLVFSDDPQELEQSGACLHELFPNPEWGRSTRFTRASAATRTWPPPRSKAFGARSHRGGIGAVALRARFRRRLGAALIGVGREGRGAFHTQEGARRFAPTGGLDSPQAIAAVLANPAIHPTQRVAFQEPTRNRNWVPPEDHDGNYWH
jgi:hypothetical protein